MIQAQVRMRSLVADMDGVILQHPRLTAMVGDRAIEFVKKTINPYMPSAKAAKINETLYKNFGHTVLGLQAIYNPATTIKHFCDYVYDEEFIAGMDLVEKEPIFYEHSIEVKEICDSYIKNNKPFYIFSNAPVQWCQNALEMMGIQIAQENIIGCDSEIYGGDMVLKPMKESYHKISHYIEHREGHPYKTQFIFVDDQICNLIPIVENPYWKPVWYNPLQTVYSDKIVTVTDIQQVRFFL